MTTSATISQPEISLKKQLVRHFTLQHGYEIPDEIIYFLGRQEVGDIRELEGKTNKMITALKNGINTKFKRE